MNTIETVEERVKRQMIGYGMFQEHADAALKEAMPQINKLKPDYKEMWTKPADSYPLLVYKLIWVCLRPLVLSWIDANIPQAGYRPSFERKNK